MYRTCFAVLTAGVFLFLAPQQARAIEFGQVDTFEDGTVQGWAVNLLGQGGNAPPPENIPDGGPLGNGDNYMRLRSLGGTGGGSKMVVINQVQWAGNYTQAGVTEVTMQVNNLGDTDLNLRLLFEDPVAGPPTNIACTTESVFVAAHSGWTNASFAIRASDLTALLGSADTVLANTTAFRIYHSPTPTFPPPSIVALLGVDNIAAVPEPCTMAVLAGGLATSLLRRRRSAKSSSL